MGAPNVHDTTYVNSGPGVGLGSSVSSIRNSVSSLAKSISHAATSNPAASFIREAVDRPVTSALSASNFDNFVSDYGLGFDMEDYYDKLMELTNSNNEWSAAQAQKQMDFQNLSNLKAMSWSAAEAQKSREWTESLSNSAHQREMKDLIAAGLNPILAANNGAYSGSGATGQAFSSSGAMGQTDMSAAGSLTNFMSGIMNTARDLAVTKMQMANQRYMTDMQYAAAKLSAGASIYNNNNNLSAQKAISQLNRDADIQRASISADASRAAAAMSAGAMTSAAATNAAAAKYSADKHAEAAKYGSDKSSGASMYGSDRSLEGTKYGVDRNIKNNPLGYATVMAPETVQKVAESFSNIDNLYYPNFNSSINLLGSD